MNYFHLTSEQLEWKERVAEVAERVIAPRAAEYDAKAQFPKESLQALGDMGLWALRVDKEHGGLGGDMVTTCLIVEEIAKKCPSTAMCYKMHLESVEAVSRIPTRCSWRGLWSRLPEARCLRLRPAESRAGRRGRTGDRLLRRMCRFLLLKAV